VFNDVTQGDIDVNRQFNGAVYKADRYRPSGSNGAISTQKITDRRGGESRAAFV
jgi:hypothetical protein